MKIFLTGGAGYIGTHVLCEILSKGWHACVFDNFSNSSPIALDRVEKLSKRLFKRVVGDIRDRAALYVAMADFRPDAVIHLAGLKSVGESAEKPLLYFDVNVQGSIVLFEVMNDLGVENIVFSSSATVYGNPLYVPQDEAHPVAPLSPYGRTKAFVEDILCDWVAANTTQSAVILRYFNPVGAHISGMIGEDPSDFPNNLMPFICQVAIGRRGELTVFGDDYETRDGTGERDYIHVVDLARAHISALEYSIKAKGWDVFNIGTGQSTTVLELVRAFEASSEIDIPFKISPRRTGDIAKSYATPAKAHDVLGWQADNTLDSMCRSAWKWQMMNPAGYTRKN